jgi:Rne/Rng family ribonuclease
MSKELIVSVTPQETKAAILENDQAIEIYVERGKEQHGLVGSIFRGRVTKVLPGMQSAFVDIGLDRDSFLYVSDFFEDTEEYDKIVSTAEEQVARMEEGGKEVSPAPLEEGASQPEPGLHAPSILKYQDRRGRSRRSRRSRLRTKRFEEATPSQALTSESSAENVRVPKSSLPASTGELPTILPGESLAKYQHTKTIPLPPETVEEGSQVPVVPLLDPLLEPEMEDEEEDTEEIEPAGDLADELDVEEEIQVVESQVPAEEVPEAVSESVAATGISSAVKPSLKDKVPAAVVENIPLSTFEYHKPALDSLISPLVQNTSLSASVAEPVSISEKPVGPPEEKGVIPKVPVAEKPGSPDEAPAVPPVEIRQPAQTQDPGTPQVVRSEPASSLPSTPSQAQYRNAPNTPKFFRKNLDRRRRPHPLPDDRKENGGGADYPLIADLLKEGQEILVQISKEPLGTKGARITSHIALPGRYLVYMPTVNHIGVSRKIESEEERQRLKKIILENRGNLPGGFIVRTAGGSRGEEEFRSDIRFLSTLWAEIKSKSDRRPAPALIHRDLNLVQRLLRDQLSADFSAIRVDNETEYASVLEFVNRFQPSLVNRVKLYTKETPIFEEFGVQEEVERALRAKVWLKSGGYIVIDQTEALVAIDVNTGKYVGKSNKLEDTIVKTNIEAAKEIARQIRLRDLGGIIVCDFIDMEDRKNRQKVTQTLEEALRADKSPSKILQFNDFGLVAITRKRVKQSLLKIYCEPCSYCNGAGMVKSPRTVCYEIQAEAKKMAKALEENKEITVRVNPEVAKALKTEEASVVTEIETLLKKEVLIKSDPLLHQEHFDIF